MYVEQTATKTKWSHRQGENSMHQISHWKELSMFRHYKLYSWLYILPLVCVLSPLMGTASAQQAFMIVTKGTAVATVELVEQPIELLAGTLSEELAHRPAKADFPVSTPLLTPVEDEPLVRGIVVNRWQPGVPSRITVPEWQPGAPSRIVVNSWQPGVPSRITVPEWQPGAPSRITVHGLKSGG